MPLPTAKLSFSCPSGDAVFRGRLAEIDFLPELPAQNRPRRSRALPAANPETLMASSFQSMDSMPAHAVDPHPNTDGAPAAQQNQVDDTSAVTTAQEPPLRENPHAWWIMGMTAALIVWLLIEASTRG